MIRMRRTCLCISCSSRWANNMRKLRGKRALRMFSMLLIRIVRTTRSSKSCDRTPRIILGTLWRSSRTGRWGSSRRRVRMWWGGRGTTTNSAPTSRQRMVRVSLFITPNPWPLRACPEEINTATGGICFNSRINNWKGGFNRLTKIADTRFSRVDRVVTLRPQTRCVLRHPIIEWNRKLLKLFSRVKSFRRIKSKTSWWRWAPNASNKKYQKWSRDSWFRWMLTGKVFRLRITTPILWNRRTKESHKRLKKCRSCTIRVNNNQWNLRQLLRRVASSANKTSSTIAIWWQGR